MPTLAGATPARSRQLRRIAKDWAPPALVRAARRIRDRRGAAPRPAPAEQSPTPAQQSPTPAARPAPRVGVDARWDALTKRTLDGLDRCEPIYRPTSFWGPGVRRLLSDMDRLGLEAFKHWPTAFSWFYPTYGVNQPMRRLREMAATLSKSQGGLNEPRLVRALRGAPEAERDFDAARLAWNHEAWPVDLDAFGESTLGAPLHRYAVGPDSEVRYTKPYLNYMLCMAALSRHVDEPPRSFVELGGGFGVLGEFVLARDTEARYVNFDIPPLLTVSSYYLTSLFGDERVRTFDEDLPESGPIELPGSACLPNWRIGDLVGDYDVFVNSYSFQEMEPFVVEHYIDTVARLGVKYAVSLNSIHGKHIAQGADDVGVKEQVVSDTIIAMFEARGYELAGRYHRPLITGAGELAILRRR